VGSQLSEEKLNDGVGQLSDKLGVDINEFAVAAIKEDDEYLHQWVLGTNKDIDEKVAAQILDEILQGLNKNYKVARTKALQDVRVKAVRPDTLYSWLESRKNKKGGQIKLPKVMKEKMMLKLLDRLG
jgi:alpha-tubulin suppressor-like RCC1 family protein